MFSNEMALSSCATQKQKMLCKKASTVSEMLNQNIQLTMLVQIMCFVPVQNEKGC